jgi:hypothetical protein
MLSQNPQVPPDVCTRLEKVNVGDGRSPRFAERLTHNLEEGQLNDLHNSKIIQILKGLLGCRTITLAIVTKKDRQIHKLDMARPPMVGPAPILEHFAHLDLHYCQIFTDLQSVKRHSVLLRIN